MDLSKPLNVAIAFKWKARVSFKVRVTARITSIVTIVSTLQVALSTSTAVKIPQLGNAQQHRDPVDANLFTQIIEGAS
jgi:hypothetical protein